VNDIHIRYEDSGADPAHPFAMGIMLENISVQSTDENWEPKFVSGEEKARKLFDFQNFAAYFDTVCFVETTTIYTVHRNTLHTPYKGMQLLI